MHVSHLRRRVIDKEASGLAAAVGERKEMEIMRRKALFLSVGLSTTRSWYAMEREGSPQSQAQTN